MGERHVDLVQELVDLKGRNSSPVFGEKIHDRRLHPFNMGTLSKPDGFGRLTGKCGDTMEVYLSFKDEIVIEATFETDGCGSSKLCGSFAAEMCLGKTPDEIMDISGDAVLEKLGGLPQAEQHCARLAAETVQEALHDYMVREREKKDPDPALRERIPLQQE